MVEHLASFWDMVGRDKKDGLARTRTTITVKDVWREESLRQSIALIAHHLRMFKRIMCFSFVFWDFFIPPQVD